MKRTPLRRKTPLRPGSKPLARRALLRRSPVKQVNPERVAKRKKQYANYLRSAAWRKIKMAAFERDGGMCQCEQCRYWRSPEPTLNDKVRGWFDSAPAVMPIGVWFDTKGKPHGFDTHHVTYLRFGNERLEDVLTMRPECHRRVEAEHGKRGRYLNSGRG